MPGSERPTNAAARRYPESPSFSHGEVQHTHSPRRSQVVCLSRQQFSIWRSTASSLGGGPPHDKVGQAAQREPSLPAEAPRQGAGTPAQGGWHTSATARTAVLPLRRGRLGRSATELERPASTEARAGGAPT